MNRIEFPENEPILGTYLFTIKEEWGLTTQEMSTILGLSPSSWNRMTNAERVNQPIKDLAICSLIRYYAKNPDKIPIIKTTIEEFVKLVEKLRPETWKSDVGLILGRAETSSYYRWMSYGCKINASALNIADIIVKEYKQNGLDAAKKLVEEFERLAKNEKAMQKEVEA